MNNWSDEARNELERFLVAERGWLARDQDDADIDHEEVIADLRAHVREELALHGHLPIELEHMQEVLQRLRPGFGTADEVSPSSMPPTGAPRPAKATTLRLVPVSSWSLGLYMVFGVLLPALALILEMAGHPLRGDSALDPIPEPINIFLIALVPIMNTIMLQGDRRKFGPITMGFAGAALMTTILYSILFLPLLPIGVIAIAFMGIGFLVLSPQLSMIVTWRLIKLCRAEGASRGARVGGILTVLLLCLNTAPILVVNLGAEWATDADPGVRSRGLSLLRDYGSEDRLLRYCYGTGNRPNGMFELASSLFASPPAEAESRELYYLVTGTPFNSIDPPASVLAELEQLGWDAEGWTRRSSAERALGGTEVAGRVEGLTLRESRLDAQIETEAALYYLEWELDFRNDSDTNQEARAQVQLPPGSYVSRLTLWVDGEEREAAFAETGKVRQAYTEVAVVQRRDPVLVTHSGTDQVLVQCFPVPAGGSLRTRIGITAPLLLMPGAQGSEATLSFPRFTERNFALAPDLAHEVWLQGRGEYLALPEGLVAANPDSDQLLARGSLSTAGFDEQASAVRVSLELLSSKAWTHEGEKGSGQAVLQTLTPVTSDPIKRLILVLDGGAGLEQAGEALAIAIEQIPVEVELGLIIAGGSPSKLSFPLASSPSRLKALKRLVKKHDFEGGINSAPSLVAAFDLAQAQSGGAVVWLHGAQPVTFSGTASLKQRLERGKGKTRIHALAATPGINKIVADFGHHSALAAEARTGDLANDLTRLLRELTLGAQRLEPLRERLAVDDLPADALPVSKHLARLWAGDKATAQQALQGSASRNSGVELAKRYHLVTPRTGAVVLETQAQFDRHGLKPVTVDEVPSVPEPETIALLLLAGVMLGFVVMRGRAAA